MTHEQKPECAFYTNTIKMPLEPDPFKIGIAGGTISFFKDGRVEADFADPDEAAKVFLRFVEQHYQRHILEAEARGAAEQRRKDAEVVQIGTWQRFNPGYGWIDTSPIDLSFYEERGFETRPLYTRPANVAALAARVKELEALLRSTAYLLGSAHCSTGICGCGDSLSDHAYESGHTPRDSGTYAAIQIEKAIKAYFEKEAAIREGEQS